MLHPQGEKSDSGNACAGCGFGCLLNLQLKDKPLIMLVKQDNQGNTVKILSFQTGLRVLHEHLLVLILFTVVLISKLMLLSLSGLRIELSTIEIAQL